VRSASALIRDDDRSGREGVDLGFENPWITIHRIRDMTFLRLTAFKEGLVVIEAS